VKYIAAYIRVSTDEQADKGNSLAEQQERLSAYCKAMGWPEPTFYVDDGYSAKNLNRPAIKRLLEDVQQNKIGIVLTSKLDRLCRNLLDLLQVVELLNAHNCSYVSASESFDTSTASGRLTLQLLGTFAEFERERISERVKDNMLSIAKNTSRAITRPCYGYDIVDGQYVINESEAYFVRMMFDLAEQGHGHRMIAKILNGRGATTKLGKPWDQVNVKRLMQTETIAGVMVYNKRQIKNGRTVKRDRSEWVIKENNHPAIIPLDRFERVQEIMRSRSRAKKHADSETYLLTGLVKCKHCGRNMKGSTARHKTKYNQYTYYRYICSSYILGYGCKHHTVHRDDLEQTIINQIKEIASASAKELKISVAHASSVADEIKNIKDQLARIDRRMQKQIEAYENDLISADDLKAARQRIETERQELKERLENLEHKKANPEEVQKKAAQLLGEITGGDRVKAKHAIRQLIEEIQIEDGKLVDITWRG
jgi:site-specific DNA recombinase